MFQIHSRDKAHHRMLSIEIWEAIQLQIDTCNKMISTRHTQANTEASNKIDDAKFELNLNYIPKF